LWKYQFYNPLVGGNKHKDIHILPHAFLVSVLYELKDGISSEEYILFLSRTRSLEEFDTVIDNINKWRKLSKNKKLETINKLKDTDKSIYCTIERDKSYAFAFHNLASYLLNKSQISDTDIQLQIDPVQYDKVSKLIEYYKSNSIYIEFDNAKDWIAYYGDIEKNSNIETALSLYEDRSDIERAVEVFKKSKTDESYLSVTEYRQIQISEKKLEDILELDLSQIEPHSGLKLIDGGRQYSTLIGKIDLLAIDQNGDYVVIELKKGRTSDHVIGQICRYIGWIKKKVASSKQKVRGIIVTREVDSKLDYAVEAFPDGMLSVKVYDFSLRDHKHGES
jgi:RecB family endonuclease NucS